MNTQWRQALALANETRLARAEVRRWLKSQSSAAESSAALAQLLSDPPPALGGVLVFELVTWGAWLGEAAARRLMRRAQVSESVTVGALTARQRRDLVAQLLLPREGWGPAPTAGPGPRSPGRVKPAL